MLQAWIHYKFSILIEQSTSIELSLALILFISLERIMVHPRIIEWHNEIEFQQTESLDSQILSEMDSEEATSAFFADWQNEHELIYPA